MSRHTYTSEQRAEAVALYAEHGPSEAARRTGIPKGTIASWANRDGLQTDCISKTAAATEAASAKAARLREDLRLKLLEKMHDALARMDEAHVDYRGKDADLVTWDKAPSGDMKNYATTFAILLDKYRLEVGEATSRSEVSNVSDVDRELAALADELRSRASSPVPVVADSETGADHPDG